MKPNLAKWAVTGLAVALVATVAPDVWAQGTMPEAERLVDFGIGAVSTKFLKGVGTLVLLGCGLLALSGKLGGVMAVRVGAFFVLCFGAAAISGRLSGFLGGGGGFSALGFPVLG